MQIQGLFSLMFTTKAVCTKTPKNNPFLTWTIIDYQPIMNLQFSTCQNCITVLNFTVMGRQNVVKSTEDLF